MNIKPWREIAKPHKDVLEGTFKQSEFAADISLVVAGKASAEYQDAEKFFSRTFITEGMRLLLVSVAQRLAGQGGDPVIQLQTAFGGGKTHALLAVYHLAKSGANTKKLDGIPTVLDEAGISQLPLANVAVLDGVKLGPSKPLKRDGQTINTLWGELAWQLLGSAGYDKVAQADQDGTSPGKDVLTDLLTSAAPCVVLVDELLAFIRQFEAGKQYKAGTFDTNISFVQALTEAMKAVPNAILLASLPESDLEAGGETGQKALKALEKYFGRVESVWKPVASEEAFEIVRRRLFDAVGDDAALETVCRNFSDFYRNNSDKFPPETQTSHYHERLHRSYPIHPEVFDRLYEDWSTLENFQRTRGVLQYMAIVIHKLWNSNNQDALIMPGSIPMEDGNVRNKSIHYLPQGWEPVIEKEIDGQRSEPASIDGLDTRFGGVQAARRAARTIFLGSAPSVSSQTVRGIKADHILLGSVQPGQAISVFEDVLRHLRDRLHYLYSEKDRFWYDTKPNLRREMESRKQKLNEQEDVLPLLKHQVSGVFGSYHEFAGIHVFTPSVDVPDEWGSGPRLVVLPPTSPHSGGDDAAQQLAKEILSSRGEQPRQKRNRLVFLAPDGDTIGRAKDQARNVLAWQSILDDFNADRMVYQSNQLAEVRREVDGAKQTLLQLVRDTWKWLICPVEEFSRDETAIKWDAVAVSPSAPNLAQEIENKLREEEWVVSEWSPIHLRNVLQQWYFRDGVVEVSALKVYQDCCCYLYLPRLQNDKVFRRTLIKGLESGDFFGFADAKEGDKYLGFVFGRNAAIALDESALIIEREAAAEYQKNTATKPKGDAPAGTTDIGDASPKTGTAPPPTDGQGGAAPQAKKRRFYGSTTLDPVGATAQFQSIVDEVVQPFTSKVGVEVKVSIDIEASSAEGFDEAMQRTIKENTNTLGFKGAEFDEDA